MCEEWGASTTPLSAEDGWQSPVRGSKLGASPPPPRPPPLSFQGAVIDGPGVARLRHHSFPVQDADNAAAQMQLPGPLGSHAWAGVQAGGHLLSCLLGAGPGEPLSSAREAWDPSGPLGLPGASSLISHHSAFGGHGAPKTILQMSPPVPRENHSPFPVSSQALDHSRSDSSPTRALSGWSDRLDPCNVPTLSTACMTVSPEQLLGAAAPPPQLAPCSRFCSVQAADKVTGAETDKGPC